jgi:hypothetical protein
MKRRANALGLLITGFVIVVVAAATEQVSAQENKQPRVIRQII